MPEDDLQEGRVPQMPNILTPWMKYTVDTG